VQTLLVATTNEGKLSELRDLLGDSRFKICSLNNLPDLVRIDESGATFVENASLKASGYAIQAGILTLADDSGLEVCALRGAPGVLSARYAGEHASDADRINKLLNDLSLVGSDNRSARFVSAIAIANNSGKILDVSLGSCEGMIANAPRGSAGFGYDPIFVPNGYDLTFAELLPEMKNQISHRAQALAQARDFLRSLTVA